MSTQLNRPVGQTDGIQKSMGEKTNLSYVQFVKYWYLTIANQYPEL